jgi:hypothetical protein
MFSAKCKQIVFFLVRYKIYTLQKKNIKRVDLLHPEDDIKFYLHHFKQKKKECGVFFNFLTNLNKFVAYE